MEPLRVLIAEDMAVMRHLLQEVLATAPELYLVGAARDGREAVELCDALDPDVIIMDVIMPEMDGIQATAAIRKSHPNVTIVMFSALTDTGAEATLDALAAGANDYVRKPSQAGHLHRAIEMVTQDVVPKVIRWGMQSRQARNGHGVPAESGEPARPAKSERGGPPEILAVGVSTGGPNALADLLKGLPPSFPLPIVIVQHMPARFTPLLAQRLTASTPFTVRHGDESCTLTPGQVILAPGGSHLEVVRTGAHVATRLNQDPPRNSCRPSVDILFESVAEVYRDSALALVMTGMGEDGLRGCRSIRNRGGQVLVQDEQSSVVWGMPGAVVAAGLANEVLPLSEIPASVMRHIAEVVDAC